MPLQISQPDKVSHYNEIPQSCKTKFAFVRKQNNKMKILHTPVKCRDFLLDTLVWQAKEVPKTTIYEWSYHDYCEELAIFNVTNVTNLSRVREVEHDLQMQLTKLVQTEDPEIFYVKYDPEWRKNTALFSFYTLILRSFLGRNQTSEDLMKSLAWEGVNGTWAKMMEVVNKAKKEPHVCTAESKKDKYTVHNTSGICSYFMRVSNA